MEQRFVELEDRLGPTWEFEGVPRGALRVHDVRWAALVRRSLPSDVTFEQNAEWVQAGGGEDRFLERGEIDDGQYGEAYEALTELDTVARDVETAVALLERTAEQETWRDVWEALSVVSVDALVASVRRATVGGGGRHARTRRRAPRRAGHLPLAAGARARAAAPRRVLLARACVRASPL